MCSLDQQSLAPSLLRTSCPHSVHQSASPTAGRLPLPRLIVHAPGATVAFEKAGRVGKAM
eukprot:scaffold16854_cov39-Tisochrysis_lutea.AAC.4